MNTQPAASIEPMSNAKQRVLDVAERLFMERGYAAIKLRDIADELDIRQATLYHHFPGGKEQLFVAVAEHVFTRHGKGMSDALQSGGNDLQRQLQAASSWFASQPPLNLLPMLHSDMPALSDDHIRQLSAKANETIFHPLRSAFAAAIERGDIRPTHPDMLAGSFLSILDGITHSQKFQSELSVEVAAHAMIDILLNGLRPRHPD